VLALSGGSVIAPGERGPGDATHVLTRLGKTDPGLLPVVERQEWEARGGYCG